MIYHILPGDAQVEEFRKTRLDGEVIVFREALITGPVDAQSVDRFWDERAQFILAEYGEDIIEYHEKVADEIDRLADVEAGDEVNLWFEYELFCSVNYWFCINMLADSSAKLFRVAPVKATPDDVWNGFGRDTARELSRAFDSRNELSADDIQAGRAIWRSFAASDAAKMISLGGYRSPCFPFLAEVSIGHALMSRALFVGLPVVVREYLNLLL
jgi:hypothetical protein